MKRLFKNDGTLLFGYWIREHWEHVPQSYLRWASENVPDFDLQLERLKQGLGPMPGIKDGTRVVPVAKPPTRKTFTSKAVRPMNHTPSSASLITMEPLGQAIREGLSRAEIARRFGVMPAIISRRIGELGLPEPRDGRKDNRVPAWAIAKKKKKSWRKDKPVAPKAKPTNARIAWSPGLETKIASMRRQKASWDAIAEACGLDVEGRILASRYTAHMHAVHGPKKQRARVDETPLCKPERHWWGKRLLIRFLEWVDSDD